VSDTPLPADRCSYWAAVIKANTCYIHVAVIAEKGVEPPVVNYNVCHPTFCGVGIDIEA
jgi:hypothetical protein